MREVNEELQAYALLMACANKDENMLRYLWDDHPYLWSDRHFEPMMRQLIESEWTDGIKVLLRSSVTHQLVKNLYAEERNYFIDNMIGDVFTLPEKV